MMFSIRIASTTASSIAAALLTVVACGGSTTEVHGDPSILSVSVSPTDTALTIGGTANLHASVLGKIGPIDNPVVTWTSSPAGIVQISGSGGSVSVSARAAGTATITATSSAQKSSAVITVTDAESVAPTLFKDAYNAQYGNADAIWPQALTMGFESYSASSNYGMSIRGAIPRAAIDNAAGNPVAAGNFRDYDLLTKSARAAANVLAGMNLAATAGLASGTPERQARSRAFAWFTIGYSLGHLSLIYDSAAVVGPNAADPAKVPLSGAPTVNTAALSALDSAISWAGKATGQTLVDWLPESGGVATTMPRFIQVIRSFKARLRAGIARTPSERAAVNWSAVIDDANNGITSDLAIQTGGGWSAAVIQQLAVSAVYSQMTPFILGMADTAGAYRTWLATPIAQRAAFLLRTPDRRFPSGETRAAQTTASGGSSRVGTPSGSILYFRNRPTNEDVAGDAWGSWFYDNQRFWSIAAAGGTGAFVLLSAAETRLLLAEGAARVGDFARAAAMVNQSRVRAGLVPVVSFDATSPVQGGSACVPQIPSPPSFTTTACGNLFEAIKWEKRLETAFTGYAQWFIDARGWGDLVRGTPLEWPVPNQELAARQHPIYTTSRVAAVGTYGF